MAIPITCFLKPFTYSAIDDHISTFILDTITFRPFGQMKEDRLRKPVLGREQRFA
jgi:hypothetical protein